MFQSRSHIEQVSDRTCLVIFLRKPGFEPSISVTVVECFTNYATASGPTSNTYSKILKSVFCQKKLKRLRQLGSLDIVWSFNYCKATTHCHIKTTMIPSKNCFERVSMGCTREALLKWKAQYGWPPCTN